MDTTIISDLRLGFKDVKICDTGSHEIELVTNGLLACAVCNASVDAETITRTGPVVQVQCSAASYRDDLCSGRAEFDLSADPSWGPGWTNLSKQEWNLLLRAVPVEYEREDV